LFGGKKASLGNMKKNQGKEVVEQEELTYTKKIENDPNF
jgi:hypothetical protein